MECFFLIIIIIAVYFYSKNKKESRSHGESDGTGWRTAGSSQDSEDLKRRLAERRAQRMAKQRREHSPESPKRAPQLRCAAFLFHSRGRTAGC